MNRFTKVFSDPSYKAFIPFFMLGYPSIEASFEIIKAAIDAGADAIELGIPFSDPVADGPVIQMSAEIALANQVDFDQCLALLKKLRAYTDKPIGLLVYYNVLFVQKDAYAKLAEAGVDAMIIGDLPVDEAQQHEQLMQQHDIGVINFIAPNTPSERMPMLLDHTTAFVYVVSVFGTTGVRKEGIPDETMERLRFLRQQSNVPLVLGFGLSKKEQVQAAFDAGANGAIIGSAFTKMITQCGDDINKAVQCVAQFVREVK